MKKKQRKRGEMPYYTWALNRLIDQDIDNPKTAAAHRAVTARMKYDKSIVDEAMRQKDKEKTPGFPATEELARVKHGKRGEELASHEDDDYPTRNAKSHRPKHPEEKKRKK